MGFFRMYTLYGPEGFFTCWSGHGAPPLCASPPSVGLPALEMTHPFHGKMTPSMTLGPMCNHDLGVLLRLPSRTTFQTAVAKAAKDGSVPGSSHVRKPAASGISARAAKNLTHVEANARPTATRPTNEEVAISSMLEAMGDHEFYWAKISRILTGFL